MHKVKVWGGGGSIFGANLAPLVRTNVIQLSEADLDPLAEMTPSVNWNGHLRGKSLDNNDLNQVGVQRFL